MDSHPEPESKLQQITVLQTWSLITMVMVMEMQVGILLANIVGILCRSDAIRGDLRVIMGNLRNNWIQL